MEMAAGVIAAKARSMMGRQLVQADYEELSHKRSVAEIASYLKNATSYGSALKDVRENHIHRGQLEDLLRKENFRKSMKLFRYSESSQQPYYLLYMQQIEIDLILSRIRVLISQSFDSAIVEFPIFLKKYTSYDLEKLGNVRSYDDLLDVVKKLMYYDVLLPYRVKKGEESSIAYAKIETALQKQFYEHAMKTISKVLKGSSRKQCRELYAMQAELSNIEKIYRLKKYFDIREDVIAKALVPIQCRISKTKLDELLACSLPQFIKQLETGPYHLALEGREDVFIEHYTEAYLYNYAKKNIFFASEASTVYSSYLIMMDRELKNIVHIIEGVRYQLSSEEILAMLVY